jgi:hypothetical protein
VKKKDRGEDTCKSLIQSDILNNRAIIEHGGNELINNLMQGIYKGVARAA